jgi:hypothetical protein
MKTHKGKIKKINKKRQSAPKIIALDPTSVEARYRKFIEETEGKENKGGDPRLNEPTRQSLDSDSKSHMTMKERAAEWFKHNAHG